MRLSLRLAKISMEGEVATKLECSSTASWKLNLSKGVLGFLTRVGNLLILRVMTYCVVGAIAVLAGAPSSQAKDLETGVREPKHEATEPARHQ